MWNPLIELKSRVLFAHSVFMSLTNDKLAAYLPAGSIQGISTIDLITLGNSHNSIVQWLVTLLDGVAKLTTDVNTARQGAIPPLDPIDLATKSVSINGDIVNIQFYVNFVGSLSNINSTVIDPTGTSPFSPGTGV